MTTIPQRYRQTDGQRSLAIPRSTRLRALEKPTYYVRERVFAYNAYIYCRPIGLLCRPVSYTDQQLLVNTFNECGIF